MRTQKEKITGICKNCAKSGRGYCKVLVSMIGKYEECWAWTDDKNWEERIKKSVKEYAKKKKMSV